MDHISSQNLVALTQLKQKIQTIKGESETEVDLVRLTLFKSRKCTVKVAHHPAVHHRVLTKIKAALIGNRTVAKTLMLMLTARRHVEATL